MGMYYSQLYIWNQQAKTDDSEDKAAVIGRQKNESLRVEIDKIKKERAKLAEWGERGYIFIYL